jgi:5-methylcytosine-specific restriction endonuclease McrA
MPRSLVLNSTHQPLAVVPARRAVVLVLKEKAVVLASNGVVFRSERFELPAPSVVRLRYFVHVPFRAHAALTRRAVFARDEWTCQYCGSAAENVDHVIPRSRGGPHSWDNVVAACRRCNHTKADRSLAEMGWALPHPPRTPSGAAWRLLGTRTVDPRWREWLGVPESVSA